MAPDKSKKERKKVALDQDTYDKLKTFTRFNGLKLRLTVDAMIDLVLEDETLRNQVIDLTNKKASEE